MNVVCDIARAAAAGCRAKKGLPSLLRLRQRATQALVAAGKTSSSIVKMEDDDLDHLDTSTKLRRIASPPSKRNSPNAATPPDNSSPQSPRSIATSATLADPVYYDSSGMGLMSMMGNGIVQPPPPMSSVPVGQIQQAPQVPQMPSISPWTNDVSPVLENPSNQTNTNSNLDQPFGPTWTIDQFNFSPSSFHSLNSFGSFGSGPMTGSPIHDQYDYSRMGLDVDMGTTSGVSFGGQSVASGGGVEDVDFDMFINQLGGGEVGLDGTWS